MPRDGISIRAESRDDHQSIRKVHIAAFRDHPLSQHNEQLIVDALRADGALTISLVAETEGAVVGHVAFSPVRVNSQPSAWYALGPVGVIPALQRQGIGSSLVVRGLEQLGELRAEGCVVLGEPEYYGRFGFRHRPELILHGVPEEFFLCLPMADHVPSGTVEHHPAFHE